MRYLERDKEEILDCLDFIENYTVTNPIKYYKEYYEQRRTLNKIKEILKEDKR